MRGARSVVKTSSPGQSAGDRQSMARILVAEDDTAVKRFVSRALAHRGHRVTTVEDGVKALEALDGDRLALLLPDIVLPRIDGMGLALQITTSSRVQHGRAAC